MDELLLREPDQPAHIEVYTDGGCEPNPGPGGWAAIVRLEGREWVLSGNDPATTNNRMELQAAVAALALLDRLQARGQIELYTDSQYLQQGITEWVDKWVRNGWRTTSGEAVKNQDLWQTLYQLAQAQAVTWHWLKGHAAHPLNERADQLAAQARRSMQIPPAGGPAAASGAAAEHLTSVTVCIKVAGRSGAAAGA